MKSSKAKANSGGVAAHPAGSADGTRAGEFKRLMERLRQHRWELDMEIAAITPAVTQGKKARRLNRMGACEVVRWAIDELTVKGKAKT